jgi:hypothetical protein
LVSVPLVLFLEPERPSLVKDSAHQRPSLVKDSAGSRSIHPWLRIVLRVGPSPSLSLFVLFLEPERPSLVKDSAHQRPSLVKDSAGSRSIHPWSRIVLRVGSSPSLSLLCCCIYDIRHVDGYYQDLISCFLFWQGESRDRHIQDALGRSLREGISFLEWRDHVLF